jgi:hypothetical protein
MKKWKMEWWSNGVVGHATGGNRENGGKEILRPPLPLRAPVRNI